MKFVKPFLLALLLTSQAALAGYDFSPYFSQPERPTLASTFAIPPEALNQEYGGKVRLPIIANQRIYALYERLIVKLLEQVVDRRIFLFSRDMEDLHDAIQAALWNFEGKEVVLDRIKTLQVSRKIIENSSEKQLRNWLLVQGLDLEAIEDGKERALLLDTGYKSTIFNAIYRMAFLFHRRTGWTPQHALNFLDALDARLLSSWHPNTSMPKLRQALQRGVYSSPLDIARLFQPKEFFFDEILSARDWSEIGFDLSADERMSWIINNIERQRTNWRPRVVELSEDGSRVIRIEAADARDARVDKAGLAIYQRELYRYFNSAEVKARLEGHIMRAIEKLRGSPTVHHDIQAEQGVSEKPKRLSPVTPPRVGEKLVTPGGLELEILDLINSGNDANIYQAEDVNGRVYALKMAIDNSEEKVESLQRTRRRIQKLMESGIPTGELVEYGENYILKSWVVGRSGRELVDDDEPFADNNGGWLKSLKPFLESVADRGLYISNLSPSNLIYKGRGEWSVIDSSSIQQVSPQEARAKFQDSFERRWSQRARNTNCQEWLKREIKW